MYLRSKLTTVILELFILEFENEITIAVRAFGEKAEAPLTVTPNPAGRSETAKMHAII